MRRSPPRCASFRLAQFGFGAEPASSFTMQRLTDCFHYSPVRPEFLVSYWESFWPELAPRKWGLAMNCSDLNSAIGEAPPTQLLRRSL